MRASLFWQDGFDVYQGQLDFFRFVLQLLAAGALLAWLLKRPVRSYIMLLPPPASSRYALLNGRNGHTERPARPPRATPRDRRDRRIGTQ